MTVEIYWWAALTQINKAEPLLFTDLSVIVGCNDTLHDPAPEAFTRKIAYFAATLRQRKLINHYQCKKRNSKPFEIIIVI